MPVKALPKLPAEPPKLLASPASPCLPRCHLHRRPQAGCLRCAAAKDLSSGAKDLPNPEDENRAEKAFEGAEVEEPVVGFTSRLRHQIVQSRYYKCLRHSITSVESLMDEVQNHAEVAEPYTPHSNIQPSTFFCCLYRLAQLQPSKDQLQLILSFKGSPLVRAFGLLHVRFNCPPWEAWRTLRNFLFDTQLFRPSGTSSAQIFMGQWVEKLLTDDKYYDTLLPRLPLSLKREMALELVQLPQLRQALSKRGRRMDHRDLVAGAQVRVLHGASWRCGEVLNSSMVGRSLVLDVQLEDGSVEELPCGLVRLQERSGRSRSRSPKPGVNEISNGREAELRDEYLRRDREKAVAEDKNYFKPILKLKRMLTTKDKSLVFHSGPDNKPPPAPKPTGKEEPPEVESEGCSLTQRHEERRQQFLEVVQKYGGSRDATDRLGYHKWNQKQSVVDVLVPETLRLG